MKKRVSVYALITALSLMLLLGCSTSKPGAEGSTGAESATSAEGSTQVKEEKMTSKDLLKDYKDDYSKVITLPKNYDSLDLEVEGEYEYKEENFKASVDQILSQFQATEPVKDRKTVKEGDSVNIDYDGKMNGKAAEGTSAQGQDLVIGSHSFIDGFEDGLIGKKVGETVELKLKFPKEYPNNPDYAGKDIVFTVKINSINKVRALTYENLTDDDVKQYLSMYGYKNKDQFLKDQKKAFKEQLESQKEQAVFSAYDQKLFDECKFAEFDQKELDEEFQKHLKEIEKAAKQQKVSLEEYLAAGGYTEEQLKEAMVNNKKRSYLYPALIETMDYTLNKTEADQELGAYAAQYGMDLKTFAEQAFDGEGNMYRQMAYRHIIEDLGKKAMDDGRVTFKAPDGGKDQKAEAAPKTAGNIWLIVGGLAILVVGITAAMLMGGDKKKASKADADPKEEVKIEEAKAEEAQAEEAKAEEAMGEDAQADEDEAPVEEAAQQAEEEITEVFKADETEE